MRNIQHGHKCIKHVNSFINARFQRKPRKFAEKQFPGSRVLGPTYELSPRSRVSGPTNIPRSWAPLFGYARFT